ncbi:MAG: hypothetical protein ACXABY_29750 [Candidatus Thorarchaeota archaeon]|jgi:DNA-directed RNA polymerase specialized sigma subunit
MPFSNEFKTDKLEDAEYQPQYQAWMDQPTPQNASAMLKSIDPYVNKAIQANVGKVDPSTRSRGRRMALEAMRTFDPNRAKLSTHLSRQLQGLKRYQAKRAPGISMPERMALDRNMLDTAETNLTNELGREVSVEELADYTHLSPKRIAYVRGFSPALSEGQIAASSGGMLNPLVDHDTSNSWHELVYTDMDKTNKLIYDWTLGAHGKPTLSNQEIARRLRLSPAAISKRKGLIQQQLEQQSELSPFGG